jgi:hypothetical protein
VPEPRRRLPDFIVAGAPRSGTTWLYMLAQRHPQLAMAQPMAPEPKFFLVDELWQRGLDYYSSKWFEPLPAGRLLGEKSANYLESPVVAARMLSVLPRVKLVFLLRNPVDRLVLIICGRCKTTWKPKRSNEPSRSKSNVSGNCCRSCVMPVPTPISRAAFMLST